jgi:hypothetical protein
VRPSPISFATTSQTVRKLSIWQRQTAPDQLFDALHKKSLTCCLAALKYDLLQRTKYGAADTNLLNSSF